MTPMTGDAAIIDDAAAERRERRRQKILSQGEKRLSAILSVDGKEDRQPPVIDGLRTDSAGSTNSASSADIEFVEPRYAETLSVNRVYLCASVGLLFFVAVLSGCVHNVIPFFIALFVPLTIASRRLYQTPAATYPKHGYAVNFLLVGGWNERLVVYVGRLLDAAWEVGVDFLVVVCAFLSASIASNLAERAAKLF